MLATRGPRTRRTIYTRRSPFRFDFPRSLRRNTSASSSSHDGASPRGLAARRPGETPPPPPLFASAAALNNLCESSPPRPPTIAVRARSPATTRLASDAQRASCQGKAECERGGIAHDCADCRRVARAPLGRSASGPCEKDSGWRTPELLGEGDAGAAPQADRNCRRIRVALSASRRGAAEESTTMDQEDAAIKSARVAHRACTARTLEQTAVAGRGRSRPRSGCPRGPPAAASQPFLPPGKCMCESASVDSTGARGWRSRRPGRAASPSQSPPEKREHRRATSSVAVAHRQALVDLLADLLGRGRPGRLVLAEERCCPPDIAVAHHVAQHHHVLSLSR